MGFLFGGGGGGSTAASGGGGSTAASTTSTSPPASVSASTPPPAAALGPIYEPDGAKRMPISNSQAVIEAGRKQRARIIARSGRESTRLVNNPGTTSYIGTVLGNTN